MHSTESSDRVNDRINASRDCHNTTPEVAHRLSELLHGRENADKRGL
ncbi:MAG: hypothetical protein ACJZ8O_09240 [Pirellulaceae bacterium]